MFINKTKKDTIEEAVSSETNLSVIGKDTIIEGNVSFRYGLEIHGLIKGNLKADSESQEAQLIITETGRVEGDIHVPKAMIQGEIIGDLHASQYVEFSSKANLKGDIHYRLLEIAVGACIQGVLLPMSNKEGEVVKANERAEQQVLSPDYALTDELFQES